MSKKVQTSFKENEREQILFSEVQKHIDKSAFIKECIQYWIVKHKPPED